MAVDHVFVVVMFLVWMVKVFNICGNCRNSTDGVVLIVELVVAVTIVDGSMSSDVDGCGSSSNKVCPISSF